MNFLGRATEYALSIRCVALLYGCLLWQQSEDANLEGFRNLQGFSNTRYCNDAQCYTVQECDARGDAMKYLCPANKINLINLEGF